MTSQRDREHIFERLRSGVVPERGLEAFAVGIERQRAELDRQLDLAAAAKASFKFLRGGYGCGKTFMARLALLDAQEEGLRHQLRRRLGQRPPLPPVRRRLPQGVTELGTSACPRGALGDIIDRWIAKVEERSIDGGAGRERADFDARSGNGLEEDLAVAHRRQGPARTSPACSRRSSRLKQAGEFARPAR